MIYWRLSRTQFCVPMHFDLTFVCGTDKYISVDKVCLSLFPCIFPLYFKVILYPRSTFRIKYSPPVAFKSEIEVSILPIQTIHIINCSASSESVVETEHHDECMAVKMNFEWSFFLQSSYSYFMLFSDKSEYILKTCLQYLKLHPSSQCCQVLITASVDLVSCLCFHSIDLLFVCHVKAQELTSCVA